MVGDFLKTHLHLTLHPQKIFLKTLASGVDFLGWINFGDYRILRPTTMRRMMSRIRKYPSEETLQSYLGMLRYGNTIGMREEFLLRYWVNQ